MPTFLKRLLGVIVIAILLVALNAFLGEQGLFGFGAPPYYSRIVMLAGINVILAVSLNLVNGFTGQFSIGHAGFMAVGGYVAGAVTYYGSMFLWGGPQVHAGWLSGGDVLFVCGCLVGALVAAATGFIVGLPSPRPRGDYLALLTLGFGEILRVV